MSAFLEPVHYWLYHKIKIQEQLTMEFLKIATEKYHMDFVYQIDEKFGNLPEGELSNCIDESNIHSWLQDKIVTVEKRLSFTVYSLITAHPDSKELILKSAFSIGTQIPKKPKPNTVQDAYKLIQDVLIDGMPCDQVNVVVSEEPGKLVWKHMKPIHDRYWKEYGISTLMFYNIRKQLIKGLLKNTGITFSEIANRTFSLEKMNHFI